MFLTFQYRTRNRNYISQGDAGGNCGEELTDRIQCIGKGPDCPGRLIYVRFYIHIISTKITCYININKNIFQQN